MATTRYTVIPRTPIKGVKGSIIYNQTELDLTKAEAVKILRQGSKLKVGEDYVTLDTLGLPKSEITVNETVNLCPDYTAGSKQVIRSECKVFGNPDYYIPEVIKIEAPAAEVPDTTEDNEEPVG